MTSTREPVAAVPAARRAPTEVAPHAITQMPHAGALAVPAGAVEMPCHETVVDTLDAVTAHQRACDDCARDLALYGEVA